MCSLYLGELEEGVRLLESLVVPFTDADGGTSLNTLIHDAAVLNLTTLYEVESDRSNAKKIQLLERFAAIPGECVNVTSFKL